jgi:3-deoxy-manno-octulosonate cytidylyltransferase (CMP-KDO synthetase)
MNFIAVIPARYASTRFPGKPLVDINGKSMIQRVYEQALKSSHLSQVCVATDDARIFDHVTNFGGKVVFTSESHNSGTDRCFEAAQKLNLSESDIVLNIQGDEPFIHPEQIDLICGCFRQQSVNIATLVKKISTFQELENNSIPKVSLTKNFEALYFTRSCIPFVRGKEKKDWLNFASFYKHIGIYAYRLKTLAEITHLPQGELELAESLEQLRWLENGYKIQTAITNQESISIDTPEDLQTLFNSLK